MKQNKILHTTEWLLPHSLSHVSFSFFCYSLHLQLLMQQWGLFSPLVLYVFSVCAYISGSITISYRCKQWWVSIKVFRLGLKGSKIPAGGLTRSETHLFIDTAWDSGGKSKIHMTVKLCLTFLGLDTVHLFFSCVFQWPMSVYHSAGAWERVIILKNTHKLYHRRKMSALLLTLCVH